MKTGLFVPAALALFLCVAAQARLHGTASTCNGDGLLAMEANAPLLSSGALTQLNMGALFATSGQPTGNLVTVVVSNRSNQARSFRILFELKLIPSDPTIRASCADPASPAGQEGCWIQRGILVNQTIAANSVWVRTSSQLESETYQGKSISPESSPFQQMLARVGYVPPGAIYLNVGLLCPLESGRQEDLRTEQVGDLDIYSGVSNPLQPFLASYQPTQPPQLLSPGLSASNGFPSIGTGTPTFVWAGNLDGVDLGGESAYRFSVWDIRDDESLGEALDRRPLHTANVGRSPLTWRNEWAALESGKRYIWRIDALLRGLSNDWLPSTPYGFRTPNDALSGQGLGSILGDAPQTSATMGVSSPSATPKPQPTPEQLEIMQALSLIIGPYRPALERAMLSSLPDPNALTISGNPATRADFQALVRDILEGRATVVGAEARP